MQSLAQEGRGLKSTGGTSGQVWLNQSSTYIQPLQSQLQAHANGTGFLQKQSREYDLQLLSGELLQRTSGQSTDCSGGAVQLGFIPSCVMLHLFMGIVLRSTVASLR